MKLHTSQSLLLHVCSTQSTFITTRVNSRQASLSIYRGDSCWSWLTVLVLAAAPTSRAGWTLRHVAPNRQLPAKKCMQTVRPASFNNNNNNMQQLLLLLLYLLAVVTLFFCLTALPYCKVDYFSRRLMWACEHIPINGIKALNNSIGLYEKNIAQLLCH